MVLLAAEGSFASGALKPIPEVFLQAYRNDMVKLLDEIEKEKKS